VARRKYVIGLGYLVGILQVIRIMNSTVTRDSKPIVVRTIY
jgi:hypothetical protein